MRKIATYFFCLAFSLTMQAQGLPDSVLRIYSKAITASEKGRVLYQAFQSRQNPSQQTLSLLLQFHAYFKKQQDEVGLDYTSLFIAGIFERFGNFHEALEMAMPILPHFEQRRDTFTILRSYLVIGNSILNAENVEQGLAYYKKALPIATKI